jgi:hypothetical protein
MHRDIDVEHGRTKVRWIPLLISYAFPSMKIEFLIAMGDRTFLVLEYTNAKKQDQTVV